MYSSSVNFVPNSIFKWGRMFVHIAGTKPIPYEYNMDYNSYWWPGAEKDLENKRKNGIEANGVVMDPNFNDLSKQDYTIKNKKLLKAIKFEPFDTKLSRFGITKEYPAKFKALDKTLN